MDRWNSTGFSLRIVCLRKYISCFFFLANNQTYLWKNGLEPIPDYLWCPKNECNPVNRTRVMLNLLCTRNNSLVCLGTRYEIKPAPYICKRSRPIDRKYFFSIKSEIILCCLACPIPFEGIRSIESNEMLVVTVNRTVALIQCKHPKYNTEIKVQYQCDIRRNQWDLVYENNNFICRMSKEFSKNISNRFCLGDDASPPVTIATSTSQSSTRITITSKQIISNRVETQKSLSRSA